MYYLVFPHGKFVIQAVTFLSIVVDTFSCIWQPPSPSSMLCSPDQRHGSQVGKLLPILQIKNKERQHLKLAAFCAFLVRSLKVESGLWQVFR